MVDVNKPGLRNDGKEAVFDIAEFVKYLRELDAPFEHLMTG